MFRSARIKLTVWYLTIISFITISFSLIFYSMNIATLERAFLMQERRIESRLKQMPRFQNEPPPVFQTLISEETIKEIKTRVIADLVILNLIILSASGLLGYFLAGRTLKPIEESMKRQKSFVADAAHELKTPLTAMKTNLEVNIRNKNLQTNQAVSIMRGAVKDIDSLSLLVNSLLKNLTYDTLRNNQKKEEVELQSLIQIVVNKFRAKAQKNNINIITKLEPSTLWGDRRALTDLISILLDNAIKFNKKDGKIYVDLFYQKDKIILKIKDDGIGISQKDLEHIFDRFYKADTSRNKNINDGYGLGLSIAKQIVENHNGSIEIQSKVNTETLVTVIFNI